MRYVVIGVLLTGLAAAQNPAANSGVPPRSAPADYPAHAAMKPATLAAAIVPSEKVKKIFAGDVSSHYVVVEVAVYPEQRFDVDRFYFSLKIGDNISHAARPRDA